MTRLSLSWEQAAALGVALAAGLLTLLLATWIGRHLRGATRLGLHGLPRLAAPTSMLVGVVLAKLQLAEDADVATPLDDALDVVAIIGGFWFVARALDVAWETGRRSARLRSHPFASTALHTVRQLGRLALALGCGTVLAVKLGATTQLYLVLTALAAALTFAARDPIRNAVAFAAMVIDPPFHVGDRVRIVAYRGGEEIVGDVVEISLGSTTIRTSGRTHVVIANVRLGELRVENLSVADRRRLELSLPVLRLRADELRDACFAIEEDLRASPHVTAARAPHVWISGFAEGLRLRVSLWLRRDAPRREAQRDLLLAIRARLEVLGDRHEPTLPALERAEVRA